MSWADPPVDILFLIFGFLHDPINIHNSLPTTFYFNDIVYETWMFRTLSKTTSRIFDYQKEEKETIRNFLDLYQCLSVCRSWRVVAKQIWQTSVLSTTPWLMYHVDESEKIFFRTNLDKCLAARTNNASFACTLNLFRLQTYASYDGWLLLGNSGNVPFLYNPITSHLLQLPPLPRECSLEFDVKFVSSGDSPTDHNCIICIKFSRPSLAFCRPSVSTSWVVLGEKAEDVIFYGRKFYTIGSGGDLFVYNSEIINGNSSFCVDQPWKERKIAEAVFNPVSLPRSDVLWFYLVESKQRELLMIMRTVDKRNEFTKSLRIFKLNESDDSNNDRRNSEYPYYWNEISSLPEKECIILLQNEGMSISVDDQNGYKSNSIYFYDGGFWGRGRTHGIYDLRSCKINQKTEDTPHYYSKLFIPSKISDV